MKVFGKTVEKAISSHKFSRRKIKLNIVWRASANNSLNNNTINYRWMTTWRGSGKAKGELFFFFAENLIRFHENSSSTMTLTIVIGIFLFLFACTKFGLTEKKRALKRKARKKWK